MAVAAARIHNALRRQLDVLQALEHARLHFAREHRGSGIARGRAGTGAAQRAAVDRRRAQREPRRFGPAMHRAQLSLAQRRLQRQADGEQAPVSPPWPTTIRPTGQRRLLARNRQGAAVEEIHYARIAQHGEIGLAVELIVSFQRAIGGAIMITVGISSAS